MSDEDPNACARVDTVRVAKQALHGAGRYRDTAPARITAVHMCPNLRAVHYA